MRSVGQKTGKILLIAAAAAVMVLLLFSGLAAEPSSADTAAVGLTEVALTVDGTDAAGNVTASAGDAIYTGYDVITLTFSAAAGIESHRVNWQKLIAGVFEDIADANGVTLSLKDVSQTGTYRIRAWDPAAQSELFSNATAVTIRPKTLSGNWSYSNVDITYNAETQRPVYELTGIVDGDAVALDYQIQKKDSLGQYVTTNQSVDAGEYRISVLGIGGNSNYALSMQAPSALYAITPRRIGISLSDQSSVFGAAISVAQNAYSILNGSVLGIDSLGITIVKEDGANAGNYALDVEWSNPNYIIEILNGAFYTVRKADYDMSGVTFADMERYYTGRPQSLRITGDLPQDVRVEYSEDQYIDVGRYTITARFYSDNTNFNVIADRTAVLCIEHRPIGISKKLNFEKLVHGGLNPKCMVAIDDLFYADAGTLVFTVSAGVTLISSERIETAAGTALIFMLDAPIGNYSLKITFDNPNYIWQGSDQVQFAFLIPELVWDTDLYNVSVKTSYGFLPGTSLDLKHNMNDEQEATLRKEIAGVDRFYKPFMVIRPRFFIDGNEVRYEDVGIKIVFKNIDEKKAESLRVMMYGKKGTLSEAGRYVNGVTLHIYMGTSSSIAVLAFDEPSYLWIVWLALLTLLLTVILWLIFKRGEIVPVTNSEVLLPPIRGRHGTYAELPIPEKEFYEFEGWYTTPDFEKRISGLRIPAFHVKVYAKWRITDMDLLTDEAKRLEDTFYKKDRRDY